MQSRARHGRPTASTCRSSTATRSSSPTAVWRPRSSITAASTCRSSRPSSCCRTCRPRRAPRLLSPLRGDRRRQRPRLHPRDADLARQSRLGRELGYGEAARDDESRRRRHDAGPSRRDTRRARSPMPISGNIGPRGDGYQPDGLMSADGGRALSRRARSDSSRRRRRSRHRDDHELRRGGRSASPAPPPTRSMPAVISITVETDGRLADRPAARRRDRPRSTPPRAPRRPTTWSTAPTRRILPTSSTPAAPGSSASAASGQRLDQEPRRARRRDRTRRRRSSSISARASPNSAAGMAGSPSSAAAAAPTIVMSGRSALPVPGCSEQRRSAAFGCAAPHPCPRSLFVSGL